MLYFKVGGKERNMQEMQRMTTTSCHYCKGDYGTLKVERDLSGKKLKDPDGHSVYYHKECKVTDIMNNLQFNQEENQI